jgi:lipid II:glycine glycyltransferase (peptidoglycan interpeptide bridge formation enzyme)
MMTRQAAGTLPQSSDVKRIGDPLGWDRAVSNLGGHLLQTWLWGEFKARHGWSPIRLLLSVNGRPKIGAQILFRRIGMMTVAYVPRGPLAEEISAAELAAFTRAIDEECHRRRAIAVLIEPETHELPLSLGRSQLWKSNRVLVQPRRTIKLFIGQSDDALLAQMKPKTRYNVRLAQRRGVTIRHGSMSDVPLFYSLLQETAGRDGFGIHDIAYFEDTLRMFGDDAALLLADIGGEPAAGLLAIRAAGEAIYMYGATRTQHQRHMPAYLIQFAAMQWARDIGCSSYDLWGIPPTDEPVAAVTEAGESGTINVRDGMWGVYRFKQGFGGEIVTYPGMYERVYVPPLMKVWRMLRPNLL